MAKIKSHDSDVDVYLEVNLVENEMLDYNDKRDDSENWIPFTFLLKVWNRAITYSNENVPTFTLIELRSMIRELEFIITRKTKKEKFEDFCFTPLENYFELIIKDLEEDWLEIEIWVPNSGILSGEKHGFEEGYKFVSSMKIVKEFCNQINIQLDTILSVMRTS